MLFQQPKLFEAKKHFFQNNQRYPTAEINQKKDNLIPHFEFQLKDQQEIVEERYIIKNQEEDSQEENILIGKRYYLKGKFLGKGGFAHCYEYVSKESKRIYAGKVIDKQTLQKTRKKQKIMWEIQIHKQMSHPHIVKFEHFFEDKDNVYIMLELCQNQTLAELVRRRHCLTEFEARYYLKQIISAVKYMHSNRILHRDLKLGNCFLDQKLQIKIGDFGLATKLKEDLDLRLSICGTPNYMAPEILAAQENQVCCGYSFAADIWAIGVIMYSLIVGRPPFETPEVKETYKKIKNVEYKFPSFDQRKKLKMPDISSEAQDLITLILQKDPLMRPSMDQIENHPFFTYHPPSPQELPVSTLYHAPNQDFITLLQKLSPKNPLSSASTMAHTVKTLQKNPEFRGDFQTDNQQTAQFTKIQQWVDYSQKYGMGYKLTNGAIGVLFNDNTSMVYSHPLSNTQSIAYIPQDKKQTQIFSITNIPPPFKKKMTLLQNFKTYIDKNLAQTIETMPSYFQMNEEEDDEAENIFMKSWKKNEKVMVFHLSNDTLQANFNDKSLVMIDKRRNVFAFYSPKEPKEPKVYELNQPQYIAQNDPSAFRRFKLIKEAVSSRYSAEGKENQVPNSARQQPRTKIVDEKNENDQSITQKICLNHVNLR